MWGCVLTVSRLAKCFRVGLLSWIGVLSWLSQTNAHGPAASPLELLALEGGQDPSALVVRLNIGLAFAAGDGSFSYGCPSQWGDSEQAQAASSPDGQRIVTLGKGVPYLSEDGGCLFRARSVEGSTEDWYVEHAIHWEEDLWGLATRGAGGQNGGVLNLSGYEHVTAELTWSSGDGSTPWAPTSVKVWLSSTGEETALVLAGAKDMPAIWVWQPRQGGIDGLDEIHLDILGEGVATLALRDVSPDGEVWLVATRGDEREVWHGVPGSMLREARSTGFAGGVELVWELAYATEGILLGPIRVGDDLWMVVDGMLRKGVTASEGTFDWPVHKEVDWTCLQIIGNDVIACRLRQLLRVDLESEVEPTLLFDLSDLHLPSSDCPPDEEGAASCLMDWVHFAAEEGIFDPSALSDAGNEAASEDNVDGDSVDEHEANSSESSASTGCVGGTAPWAGWALVVLLGLVWKRCCLAQSNDSVMAAAYGDEA
jgi:hypothetical protein